jgi:hypothetical protein
VLYGARSDGSHAPLLARAGTRTAPLTGTWIKGVTAGQATSAVQRGPLLALTPTAAFVAYFYGERHAALARWDLPSGERRWEIQLAPDSIATIGASDRRVVLTWAGGTLQDGVGPDSFGLMVLDAETGAKVSQIGRAIHRGP